MKRLITALMCTMVIFGVTGCGSSSVDLSEYTWGNTLQERLDEIGVEKIKNIEDLTTFGAEEFNTVVEITTSKDTLKATLESSIIEDGTTQWKVKSICDKGDPNKLYYELANLQLNDDGTQKHDIYDYKTGELSKEGKEIAKTDSSKTDSSKEDASKADNSKEDTPKADNSTDEKSNVSSNNQNSSSGSNTENPSTGTNNEPSNVETPPETQKPDDSSNGQNNALKSARNYLNTMAFSHSGLIQQLEYEGYSNQDATYAANNCGANWSEQALKSAKNYLTTMAFSHSGLIKQLEFEGYSNQEATYGSNNCGADWNQQAAKSARNYLDTMSFSRDGLIQQLMFEGYSQEQAEYGVTQVGY